MNIQTKYKAYNASFEKCFGFYFGGGVVSLLNLLFETPQKKGIWSTKIDIDAPFLSKLLTISEFLICASYFAHNLYAQYQYNKSEEKQISVNIAGVAKVIDISPQYFDSYSMYHLLGFISCTMGVGSLILSSQTGFDSVDIGIVGCAICKLLSLCSSYNDLTFTDHETSEILSHETIIFSEGI